MERVISAKCLKAVRNIPSHQYCSSNNPMPSSTGFSVSPHRQATKLQCDLCRSMHTGSHFLVNQAALGVSVSQRSVDSDLVQYLTVVTVCLAILAESKIRLVTVELACFMLVPPGIVLAVFFWLLHCGKVLWEDVLTLNRTWPNVSQQTRLPHLSSQLPTSCLIVFHLNNVCLGKFSAFSFLEVWKWDSRHCQNAKNTNVIQHIQGQYSARVAVICKKGARNYISILFDCLGVSKTLAGSVRLFGLESWTGTLIPRI